MSSCPKLLKPNQISSRHTEGENSTETDTKTSKHRESNQKYRLGAVSDIKIYNFFWGVGVGVGGGGFSRFTDGYPTSPSASEVVKNI